jgi:hypothetical protein
MFTLYLMIHETCGRFVLGSEQRKNVGFYVQFAAAGGRDCSLGDMYMLTMRLELG